MLFRSEDNRDSAYYAGATFLILGSPAIEAADLGTAVRYLGVQESDQAGVSAGVGDLDADGFADFVVTGRGNDDAGPEAGAAYLVFGEAVPPGGLLSEWPTWQGVEDDALGPPRAGGDIDADGVPDILLGTDRDDGGRSYVLFGADALTAAGR